MARRSCRSRRPRRLRGDARHDLPCAGGGASLEYIDEGLEIVRGLPIEERHALPPLLAFLPALGAIFRNDDATALESSRELLEHPEPWIRAFSHAITGGLLLNLGEVGQAEAEMDVALTGFRELGERWGVGNVLIARCSRRSAGRSP